MVRQAKFSFDEGMNVDYPQPEDDFDDDLDEVVDRIPPAKAPRARPRERERERERTNPGHRRPDRRHLADGDWLKNSAPDERTAKGEAPGAAEAE